MRSWEETCQAGECNEIQMRFWSQKPPEELYDTENDPWEVDNLAEDPAYQSVLERMRAANVEWMSSIYDTGFIPEAEMMNRAGELPMYDYMRLGNVPLNLIIEAAEVASSPTPDDLTRLTEFLASDDSAIRYWGATGLLILGEQSRPAIPLLKRTTEDTSHNVVVVASEALYKLGEKETAIYGFIHALDSLNPFARTHALNAIDILQIDHKEVQNVVITMAKEAGEFNYQEYDQRAAQTLLNEWGVEMKEYDIDISWH